MGNCCVPVQNKDNKLVPNDSASVKKSLKSASKRFEWNEEGKIALTPGSSFGPPLLYGNYVLFLSSKDNKLIINNYNIKTKKYENLEEIKVEKPFNIQQCQYILDEKKKFIIFINNNQTIMTFDLKTKQFISTQPIITKKGQIAQIHKFNKKIYILGAEKSDDDEEKKALDTTLEYIPYDAYKKKGGHKQPEMAVYGSLSITVNAKINKKDYIFIMGGEKEMENDNGQRIMIPRDDIWIFDTDCAGKDGQCSVDFGIGYKWCKRYLYLSMTSFGCINYKDKYLITFGGFQYRKDKQQFSVSNIIYALDLKNEGKWYQLDKKLENKCGYFVSYRDGDKFVHLFSWDGRYYTLRIDDIVKGLENGGARELQPWSEQGKTVVPTKDKSIQNMGPSVIDSDDEEDDKK